MLYGEITTLEEPDIDLEEGLTGDTWCTMHVFKRSSEFDISSSVPSLVYNFNNGDFRIDMAIFSMVVSPRGARNFPLDVSIVCVADMQCNQRLVSSAQV